MRTIALLVFFFLFFASSAPAIAQSLTRPADAAAACKDMLYVVDGLLCKKVSETGVVVTLESIVIKNHKHVEKKRSLKRIRSIAWRSCPRGCHSDLWEPGRERCGTDHYKEGQATGCR